jgi:hypothetical protein
MKRPLVFIAKYQMISRGNMGKLITTDSSEVSEHDAFLIPFISIYFNLLEATPQKLSLMLPHLSEHTKKLVIDLNCWKKDQVSYKNLADWTKVYSECADQETRFKFAKSEQFYLYLKGQFNIWTFDGEDPQYPDHDYYFLTEDNQLLFEFSEETFEYAMDVKKLVRDLYSEMGVEYAYAYLFKLVSDSYLIREEEEYEKKKYRLSEIGFGDYYELLGKLTSFQNIDQLNAFLKVKEKKGITPTLNEISSVQQEAINTLVLKNEKSSDFRRMFQEELDKIQSETRKKFLEFNIVALLQGFLVLDETLDKGKISIQITIKKVLGKLTLGLDYLQNHYPEDFIIFERFDFFEIFKVATTLVESKQKLLKTAMANSPFDAENDSFLGERFCKMLDGAFDTPAKVESIKEKSKFVEINNVELFRSWEKKVDSFLYLLPVIGTFHKTYEGICKEGRLSDEMYLNFSLADIDFEAIMISSLVNFSLNNFDSDNQSYKLGVTISELKSFLENFIDKEGNIKDFDGLQKLASNFVANFQKDSEQTDLLDYLLDLVQDQLAGVCYDELQDSDYRHIGGPIILDTTLEN